jgi:hypothetical protein
MFIRKYVFNTCIFYVDFVRKRGWRRVYPVTLPPCRVSHKTRCIGHRTTHTNRRLRGLSTRGGSAGWVERYSCSWNVFLVQGSLTRGTIWGHISRLGRTCPEDGKNRGDATGWEREEWRLGAAHATIRRLGAAHARIRGLHDLYGIITCMPWCSAVFTCKRM